MQRIDAYRDDELAAAFVPGQEPTFHGAIGQEARRALANQRRFVRNPWTGETLLVVLVPDNDYSWLISSVTPALTAAGFRLTIHDRPAPPDIDTTDGAVQ